MEAIVGITYRCNARCHMCNTWKHPSEPEEEIKPELLEKLPRLKFANITGGEPFLREDIGEFVKILKRKADRVVVSSNGYFTEKITDLVRKHPRIGVRISIEGLPRANDKLRGIKDGFDHGLRSLLMLHQMGVKDIGFGITVSDRNAMDLLDLYELGKAMNIEFATAAVHNTYYFHKFDNKIEKVEKVAGQFEKLAGLMLKEKKIKSWFRAYFNMGLANFVRGNPRPLPCGAAFDMFFLDPFGDIRPCNGMDEIYGSLKDSTFKELWNSPKADDIREKVKNCDKNCWMIGTAAPAMKKELGECVKWVLKSKLSGKPGPVM